MDPTFSVGDTVLYTRSTGEQVLATILGPSSGGPGFLAISYVRNGSMVTHERAPVSGITLALIRSPDRGSPHPGMLCVHMFVCLMPEAPPPPCPLVHIFLCPPPPKKS